MKTQLGLIGVLALVSAVGCGASADDRTDKPGTTKAERAGQTAQALTISDLFPPQLKAAAKQAKSVMDIFSGISQGITIAETVAEFLGILDAAPDPLQQLETELNNGILALSWQETMQYVDTARSYASNATGSLRSQSLPYDEFSPSGALLASNSRMAMTLLGLTFSGPPNLENSAFMRVQNAAAVSGPWQQVIRERASASPDPKSPSSLLVYDWRLGVPALMDIIGKRVAAIAGSDPSFSTPAHRDELLRLRALLQGHYDKMKDGVKCNFQFAAPLGIPWVSAPDFPPLEQPLLGTRIGSVPFNYTTQMACADIYTGAALVEQSQWPNAASLCTSCTSNRAGTTCTRDSACVDRTRTAAMDQVNGTVASLRRQIYAAMPLFEMQGMIDTLYMYANPAPDLTEAYQELPLRAAPPSLCLDIGNGNPLQVQPCAYNTLQWWTYNRRSGLIVNPFSDSCLEVPSESLQPGAAVALGACQDPAPLRQQWTYDPEGGVLRNGLYTVLDVQGGTLQAGTPVAMWDAHGGLNQQWLAERPSAPPPNAPSACGQLHADEGLTLGQSLSSCDGRFTLTLSWSGDLELDENVSGTRLWDTGTSGLPIAYLRMQSDGNLVLSNNMGGSAWHSNTAGHPGAVAVVQDDANLVVYDSASQPLFASNTCCR